MIVWKVMKELLYPRRCALCGEIALPRGSLACPSCEAGMKVIREPVCFRCGKQVAGEQMMYCSDCAGKKVDFVRSFALWPYDAVMKKSIGQFKYHDRREYADYYVERLMEVLGERLRQLELEALIPVPLHRQRLAERGFNQAELLADGLGEALLLPVLKDFLLRRKNTNPQKRLGRGQRRRNLEKAFVLNQKSRHAGWYWKRVLLVDDIYTTGSTVQACAAALKQAGIGEVYVLCLCVGSQE